MRRNICIITVVLAITLLGCSKEESTKVYSTSKGDIKVTKKKDGKTQELTITSKEGTATFKVGKGEIPDDLGVPVYPRALADEGSTWSLSGTRKGKSEAFSSTLLNTEDTIEEVLSFYKKELEGRNPEFFEMNTPQGKMVTITLDEDESTTTSILLKSNPEKKGTLIQISKAQK